MERRFSRKEFFDLMWSKPIKDLAPEFGISDVALAKFCRKHDFPLPGRGYWAKLKAGQPIESPSLAPRGLGKHETISIGRDEWRGREAEDARVMAEEISPPPEFPEALDSLKDRVAKLVGKVSFIKGLDRPHRAIAALLDEDKKRLEKRNASSYHSIFDEPFFASPYERRRLKLLNSIFLALAKLGVSGDVRGKNPSDFIIRVGDIGLVFQLDDPKRKEARDGWRPPGDVRRPASDPLQLLILWHSKTVEGLQLVWADTKKAQLEDSLREIVIGLIVAGEMQVRAEEFHSHDYRVSRKANLIEVARQREEEARQKEFARLQRIEKARIDKLFENAMCLRLANDLREYVHATRIANKAAPNPVPDEEIEEWARWASIQSDRIDPVLTRSFIKPVEDPGEGSTRSEDTQPASKLSGFAVTEPAWHPNRWYTRFHR